MSNGFIRLCSMVFCWAAISALLSSHMTNKDDDDDDDNCRKQSSNVTLTKFRKTVCRGLSEEEHILTWFITTFT